MNKRARLIIPVWGEHHVKTLLGGIGLPSLMAPGNVPFLSRHFACEIVLLTETRFFSYFDTLPVLNDLREYCLIRVCSIDDLVGFSSYSVPLTLAFFRGLEDFENKSGHDFVFFLNADFVLADGAYRSVVEKINQGETLFLAPSLRVNPETIIPFLEESRVNDGRVLAMASRSMVRLALDHLHSIIRLKMMNREFAHCPRFDQFYWYVDSNTLISFQFQMAVIGLSPQTASPRDVPCYIDYCAIPLLMPQSKKCVLADSDEFFMLEVQAQVQRLEGEVQPGRLSIGDIARDLDGWTTQDQRDVSSTLVCFHADDLDLHTEVLGEARAFIQQLTARLTRPARSYRNHPFWVSTFHQYIQDYKKRWPDQVTPLTPMVASAMSEPKRKSSVLLKVNRFLVHSTLGSAPEFLPAHPLWLYYRDVVKRIKKCRGEFPTMRVLWPKTSVFKKLFASAQPVVIHAYEYDDSSLTSAHFLEDIALTEDRRPSPEFWFIELPPLDMPRELDIRGMIQNYCAPGSRILYYLQDEKLPRLLEDGQAYAQFLDTLVPDKATGIAFFYGSFVSDLGKRLTERLVASYYSHLRRPALLGPALALICLLPVIVCANIFEARRSHTLPGPHTTVLLLDVTLQA